MSDRPERSLKEVVDVAVVGLGPVGATLCSILGQRGVRVTGIDAANDVYALPRAIGMDHEVMRVFQNIGIAEDIAKVVSAYRDSEYRAADGRLLRKFISPPLPHRLGWPSYMTFVQPELERQLRRRAASFETVRLSTGTELISLNAGNSATLTLKNCATGEKTVLEARYVVGCDGGGSFVRRNLGIGFEDLIFDQPWLVIDMILGENAPDLPETNIQFCNPSRPHTYVVLPDRLRRWEFMMLPGETPEAINRPERIWELLAPWIKPGEAELWRSATYRFHALVAERWRAGNIFLAGDACHMTPPFLAQGMVQGIKDAVNLGWKLASVLAGGSEGILETYEQERRPLVREVISITKGLGHIICETDHAKARTRDEDMVALTAAGKGIQMRQDLFPPIRDGLIARDAAGRPVPGAGEPCPQPWVRSSTRRSRLDDVAGQGFSLFTCGLELGLRLRDRAALAGVAIHQIGRSAEFLLYEEEDVLHAWLDRHGAYAAISRPDHVVFGTARDEAGLSALLEQLEAQLGLAKSGNLANGGNLEFVGLAGRGAQSPGDQQGGRAACSSPR